MSDSWSEGSTTAWRNLRAYVLRRDNYRCKVQGAGCTRVAGLVGGHVDHIIPKSQGGTNDPSNLRASCPTCNLGRKRTQVNYEPDYKRVSNW